MTQKEALKSLLEVVEAAIKAGDWKVDGACDPDSAIQRAREALAQPEQEPMAWLSQGGDVSRSKRYLEEKGFKNLKPLVLQIEDGLGDVETITVYTTPPQRTWVGLTPEDMPDGDNPMFDTDEFALGAAWAQAKLKEKNNTP